MRIWHFCRSQDRAFIYPEYTKYAIVSYVAVCLKWLAHSHIWAFSTGVNPLFQNYSHLLDLFSFLDCYLSCIHSGAWSSWITAFLPLASAWILVFLQLQVPCLLLVSHLTISLDPCRVIYNGSLCRYKARPEARTVFWRRILCSSSGATQLLGRRRSIPRLYKTGALCALQWPPQDAYHHAAYLPVGTMLWGSGIPVVTLGNSYTYYSV